MERTLGQVFAEAAAQLRRNDERGYAPAISVLAKMAGDLGGPKALSCDDVRSELAGDHPWLARRLVTLLPGLSPGTLDALLGLFRDVCPTCLAARRGECDCP